MKRRILVVDDNIDLAENLRELLELEGFDVTVLTSPNDVLARASQLTFDAALLDIRMPGIDGIELCAELARIRPDATYVLMTAFTSEERILDAEEAGAKAVLKKPLPVERLLRLLGAVEARTVLLVEDDADLSSSLTEVLAPHGYRIVSARTLAEARARVNEASPDVALVDVILPDGSGTELARELIARGARVIVTTGFDDDEVRDRISSLRARGASYIAKPFSTAMLLAMLGEGGSP